MIKHFFYFNPAELTFAYESEEDTSCIAADYDGGNCNYAQALQ